MCPIPGPSGSLEVAPVIRQAINIRGSDNGLAGGEKRIRTAGPSRKNEPVFPVEREVPHRRKGAVSKASSIRRGTAGSNPGPSTRESAHRSHGLFHVGQRSPPAV